MTELNDELLVAYVDGQLAKDQSKAIERVLQEDEVAAQRVEALRAANVHLENAFDAMLAGEPIPVPIEASEAAIGKRSILSAIKRAGIFIWVGFGCLIAGTAAGFILYDRIAADPYVTAASQAPVSQAPEPTVIVQAPPPATWADDVVRTHALLSPETFAFGLESEGNIDLASFHLSKALGADFTVPDLGTRGLTFHRAQLLQRDGKPFTQIAYMADTGTPVALYATARTGDLQSLTLDEKEGINLATWSDSDLSFLLAGDLPEERLRALAEVIRQQFAAIQPTTQDTGTAAAPPVPEEVGQTSDGSDADAQGAAAVVNRPQRARVRTRPPAVKKQLKPRPAPGSSPLFPSNNN